MKKTANIIFRILIAIALLLLAGLIFIYVSNKIALRNEYEWAENMGCAEAADAGDYDLNIVTYGADNYEHTIVALSGYGPNDYSIGIRTLTDLLSDNNRIVIIDRAGYGLSDDTSEPQTAERIVSDLRTALQSAGIEGPYVLLPHSLGSVYSIYWECKYPEEIEAVIFLDGTKISDQINYPETSSSDNIENIKSVLSSRLGFFRLLSSDAPDKSDETSYLRYVLNMHSASTRAKFSEYSLIKSNAQTVSDAIVETDIPKLYICATWGYTEGLSEERLAELESYRNDILIPFLERLGNCRLELLPGSHNIFADRATDCAALIEDFLG